MDVLCVPSFMADPAVDGARQSDFAVLRLLLKSSFNRRLQDIPEK
jgi:hypothetical protein